MDLDTYLRIHHFIMTNIDLLKFDIDDECIGDLLTGSFCSINGGKIGSNTYTLHVNIDIFDSSSYFLLASCVDVVISLILRDKTIYSYTDNVWISATHRATSSILIDPHTFQMENEIEIQDSRIITL